jgi:hypothetical protein
MLKNLFLGAYASFMRLGSGFGTLSFRNEGSFSSYIKKPVDNTLELNSSS